LALRRLTAKDHNELTMRIVQMTDLHVGEEGEQGFGVDVRANFLKILQATRQLQPDQIVVTGDLCLHHGSAKVYNWLKAHLDQLNISYEVIAGNHDDSQLLATAFGKSAALAGEELYFFKEWARVSCLFLDTRTAEMSAAQLQWLRDCLQTIQNQVIIFMHHPPILAHMPWMDEYYPFQMQEEIQEVFFAHPYPIQVFCGHYHIEKTIQQRNLSVHITPSCYFQIDPHSVDFKIDHYNIALREIEIEEDAIRHSVRYY
jgi:Icc protein